MQALKTVALVAAVAGSWTAGGGAALAAPVDPYSSFFVFGDSLSDNGNLFAATGLPTSPPYFNGRFSNGPVWAEALAGDFAAAGRLAANFAFGGAQAVEDGDPIPDLMTQVGIFGMSVPAVLLGDRPLASLWFGANDIFAALDSAVPVDVVAVAQAAADGVALGAQALFAAGIGDVLLFNLPDIGAAPAYALFDPMGAADATAASLAFNARLDAQADALRGQGLRVTEIDIFSLFEALLDDPTAFGVANATVPCIIPTVVVCTPEEAKLLAFFDPVHPNATIHSVVADVVRAELAPVPLPAAVWLLGLALAGLGLAGRRRTV